MQEMKLMKIITSDIHNFNYIYKSHLIKEGYYNSLYLIIQEYFRSETLYVLHYFISYLISICIYYVGNKPLLDLSLTVDKSYLQIYKKRAY